MKRWDFGAQRGATCSRNNSAHYYLYRGQSIFRDVYLPQVFGNQDTRPTEEMKVVVA